MFDCGKIRRSQLSTSFLEKMESSEISVKDRKWEVRGQRACIKISHKNGKFS